MTLDRALELARKALTKSPRHTARRLGEEMARVGWRPWTHVYPRLVSANRLAAEAGADSIDAWWDQLSAGSFFLHPSDRERWSAAFVARFPSAKTEIVAAAERVLAHEFDLLGSGSKVLGGKLPWHADFKTDRVWPLQYSPDIEFSELDRPTDVKVPWELSRCQHFTVLGQAYWLTGDERYAQEYVDQILDWIERNPWGHGVNWICAMDVALRAANWIWGFYFLAGSQACAAPAFRERLLHSLHLHGEWVATHLEKGPVNGNHYLSDGVGLVFLGVFFRNTARGRAWLASGRSIVLDEMLVQVTADGVDFEASTAYHRLVLELFFTAYQLLTLGGETIPQEQALRIERMFEFVEAYVKPNGLAPLVGDADDGRVQILGRQAIGDHRYLLSTGAAIFGRGDFKARAGAFWEESFWLLGPDGAERFDQLAATPAVTSRAFTEGGFFVLRDRGTHVFIDCGNVGMRGIGGHGHNDILSFELVLDGVPLITDCGAYLYTASREWRNRFRSTAFHNTPQVDGEEVNRFLGPDALWQLHDDATPMDAALSVTPAVHRFRGAHRGYERLSSPVRVARQLALAPGRSLVALADTLEGDGEHVVHWQFSLDPEVRASVVGGDVRFEYRGAERWLLAVAPGAPLEWSIEAGWVSASYGVRSETQVVSLKLKPRLPYQLTCLFSMTYRPMADRQSDASHLLTEHGSHTHATSSPQQ